MTNTFLGVPITGNIYRGEHKVQQRPLEDLAPLMQAVLDDEGIASFGWYQFTPYFNDGDPRVFNTYGMWAIPADAVETPDDDTYYSRSEQWGEFGYNERWEVRKADNSQQYERLKRLSDAIDSAQFDDVLLDAFGDHCEITITRTGITVEEYIHD